MSIVTFKQIFDIPLLNKLLSSFFNLSMSLTELKALLNNLFISSLNPFIYIFSFSFQHGDMLLVGVKYMFKYIHIYQVV